MTIDKVVFQTKQPRQKSCVWACPIKDGVEFRIYNKGKWISAGGGSCGCNDAVLKLGGEEEIELIKGDFQTVLNKLINDEYVSIVFYYNSHGQGTAEQSYIIPYRVVAHNYPDSTPWISIETGDNIIITWRENSITFDQGLA